MGGGCVLWLRKTSGGGYGRVKRRGRSVRVHRLSWELEHGPAPAGMLVLHKCDTPRCFNYEHLFLGTAADNMMDMAKKGRQRNGNSKKQTCPVGHPYDHIGTQENKIGLGPERRCLICTREARRRFRRRCGVSAG